MPQFKFKKNDIFHNTVKAHPKYTITMYLNNMYINNVPSRGYNLLSGSVSLYELNVDRSTATSAPNYPISLIRGYVVKGSGLGAPKQGFNAKGAGGEKSAYKNYKDEGANTKLYINYTHLTASVKRSLLVAAGPLYGEERNSKIGYPGVEGFGFVHEADTRATANPHGYWAMATASIVNKLMALQSNYDSYKRQSPYFDFHKYILVSGGVPPVRGFKKGSDDAKAQGLIGGTWPKIMYDPPGYSSTFHDPAGVTLGGTFTSSAGKTETPNFTESLPRNKYTNIIEIPKIMYGEAIKKGSVDLKFYYTGTLLARAQDTRENGELIETFRTNGDTTTTGSVIGTVLYNEGIMLITASHELLSGDLQDGYLCPTGSRGETSVAEMHPHPLSASYQTASSWAHFGAYQSYITSSVDPDSSSYAPASSSYSIEFKGTTYIPTITMMAHASKNELNWSNNPTFIERASLQTHTMGPDAYVKNFVKQTGSLSYKENEEIKIKNTISSSFLGDSSSYQPQTFISKIGVYNENKELVAVAKLANPVRKINERDYTFKLKLDL